MSSSADVLPPGSKPVSHVARFENLDDYPDYTFYLKSRGRHRQAKEEREKADPDSRIALAPLTAGGESSMNGNPIEGPKVLFAVPKKLRDKAQPLAAWFDGDHPDVLTAELGHGRRAAPLIERSNKFTTTYHVSIADGRLTAQAVKEEGDAPPEQGAVDGPADEEPGLKRAVIGGALAIAALAIGLFIYFRRQDKPLPG
jgi:hypothetical protein